MTALGLLWFVLIAVLICGYFALDGFDLGAGVLYPVLAKGEDDKQRVLRAIGPVWDGNEVWLLTAGGALFAAFAPAYASVFSGFYLAIMLVLFGLILRAVAVEFRAHGADYPRLWDVCFVVGSLLPALLLGVACGNLIQGVGLNAHGDYVGGFFALLRPFPLLCGLLGLAHMLTQGAAWIALKAPVESGLRAKAVALRRTFCIIELGLFAMASVVFFAISGKVQVGSVVLAAIFAVVYVLSTAGALVLAKGGKPQADVKVIVAEGLGCVGLVGIMFATIFPNLVPALDPALSITIAAAQSSPATLGAMTIIACIGVPLVLVYHVLVYRAFRGRVE